MDFLVAIVLYCMEGIQLWLVLWFKKVFRFLCFIGNLI